MDEPTPQRDDEAGTTLAELLVVIVLVSVVGLITTTGIVRGLNAQVDATNVAETLDGMRLATQRVRDFVREADEVCASSTQDQLVLWTDDDDDGEVDEPEKDIFELVTSVTPPVFQRRVPGSGEVQIIRDDILNGAIFIFDGDPARVAADQPTELRCDDGASVTGTVARIRSVQVNFLVDHPEPGQPDLTTSTQVRIRNADLAEKPNSAPDGSFTVDCVVGTQTCNFDASGSTDPDGTIANYIWDFGDGNGDTGVTATHTYAAGDTDYTVTLLVVDDNGAVDTVEETATPSVTSGNPRPVADFTPDCTDLICDFLGGASSDDGAVVEWRWVVDGGPVIIETDPDLTGVTLPGPGTYGVSLEVVDDEGAVSDPVTKSVTVGSNVMRVESIGAVIGNKTNNYDVTFKVALSRTTAGTPGAGVTISVELAGGRSGTNSCSTGSDGACTITVKSVPNTQKQSLEVTNVIDTTSTYLYDPAQDRLDQVVVDKNGNKVFYKDGAEVTL